MKVHYSAPSYFNFLRKDFFSFFSFLWSHFRSNNFLALLCALILKKRDVTFFKTITFPLSSIHAEPISWQNSLTISIDITLVTKEFSDISTTHSTPSPNMVLNCFSIIAKIRSMPSVAFNKPPRVFTDTNFVVPEPIILSMQDKNICFFLFLSVNLMAYLRIFWIMLPPIYATISISAAPKDVQIDFEFCDGGSYERTLSNNRKHNHVWNMLRGWFFDIDKWKCVHDCSVVAVSLWNRNATSWISFRAEKN